MENLFARKIVPEIEKYLDEPSIILITGAPHKQRVNGLL